LDNVEVWSLDLASFASVKLFVERAKALERLDVFIQNAGVSSSEWHVSEDGWEVSCVARSQGRLWLIDMRRLQVNVIAPAYMAMQLLPLMKATGDRSSSLLKPRMVFIGSDAHHRAQFGACFRTRRPSWC
jgi:retinol dehydrogenase-12